MLSTGPNWNHNRTFDSLLSSTSSANNTAQGWLWRHSMMTRLVSDDPVDYIIADITCTLDNYNKLTFNNTAADTWVVDDYESFKLTHDAANDKFTLQSPTGYQWLFRDYDYTTTGLRGTLYEIRDPYDNALTLAYDGSNRLSSVTDAGSHKMVYTYHYSATWSSHEESCGPQHGKPVS